MENVQSVDASALDKASMPVPWGVAEALALWFLFLLVQVLAGAIVGIVYGICHHSTLGALKMPSGWMLTLSSCAAMCAVFIVIWAMLEISYRIPFWKGIRWEGIKSANRIALLSGISFAVLNGTFTMLFPPPDLKKVPLFEIVKTPLDLTFFAVFAIIIAPIVEELLFRGWMYPAFRKKMSAWSAILLTTLFFVAPHTFQLGEYKIGMVLVGLVGIVNGILREKTGGVKAPFLCHLVYNSVIVIMEVANRAIGEGH